MNNPTSVDRSSGRLTRQIRKASMAGLAGRLAAGIVGLGTTPVLVRGLGPEGFGLYATVTGLTMILSFTDLGIGNGVTARIAGIRGEESIKRRELRLIIKNGIYALTGIGLLLASLAIFVPVILRDFGVLESATQGQTEQTVEWFLIVFALGIPCGIGQRILRGMQEGAAANTWATAASCAGMVSSAVAAKLHGGLPFVTVLGVLAPLLVNLSQTAICLHRLEVSFRSHELRVEIVGSLLKSGIMFLAFGITTSIAFQSDTLIVNLTLGAGAAAVFAANLKFFSLVVQFNQAMHLPLWPAITQAIAEGDIEWVRRTSKRAMVTSLATSLPLVLCLAAGLRPVAGLLFTDRLVPPWPLVAAFAVWTVQQCLAYPVSMLLVGAAVVRFQVVVQGSMSLANLALSILFAKEFGITGVIVGSICSHLLFVVIPYAYYVKRSLPRKLAHERLAAQASLFA